MEALFATFGIDWRLLLIQVVNFGVLLIALWYFLYTPVLKMIDERREMVIKGVKDAEKAERELNAIEATREETIASARKEAGGIVANAKQTATEAGDKLKADAEARAEAIVADATTKAAEAKARAERELEKEVSKTAMLAAEKILKERNA